jgi:hypothetical protein
VDELERGIALNMAEALALVICGLLLAKWSLARPLSSTPSRSLPRTHLTMRGMMLFVAWAGLAMGAVRWLHLNFATVYAPGYDESHFRRVRVGMTRAEVESIMGPPLRRDNTSQRWAHYENWIYSDPTPPGRIGDNYWRRWVMFDRAANGKVAVIVSDYYVD